MAHVYRLTWPGKEGVYVGCSTQVEVRHIQHKCLPQSRKLFLMQELYGDPEIEVLEEVADDKETMLFREAYWMVKLGALDGTTGGLNGVENAQCAYWAGNLGLANWFEEKRTRLDSHIALEDQLIEKVKALLGPHVDTVEGFWKDRHKLDQLLEHRASEKRVAEIAKRLGLKPPVAKPIEDDAELAKQQLERRRALAQSLINQAMSQDKNFWQPNP